MKKHLTKRVSLAAAGLLVLSLSGHADAQVYQVADLAADTGKSSSPNHWFPVGDRVYFTIGDPDALGQGSLVRTDGTVAGTEIVTPLDGRTVATGHQLGANFLFGGTVDAAVGRELWITDGTSAGTSLVMDINPGSDPSSPQHMVLLQNQVFFSADNGTSGRELWITDGTAGGTTFFDLVPGIVASDPSSFTVAGNRVFFVAEAASFGRELWVTDGTGPGTYHVADIGPGDSIGGAGLIALGQDVLFAANDGTNGRELWRSDGTLAGTTMVADIQPGPTSSLPGRFINFNGEVFFRADDGVAGSELWKTDGTAMGTSLVADINPGPDGSSLDHPIVMGSELFFAADDGVVGSELWKTDGTTMGTSLAVDVLAGAIGSFPDGLTALGSSLLCTASTDGFGNREWHRFDPAAGTLELLVDLSGSTSGASQSTGAVVGDIFITQMFDRELGREPWVTDGTPAGTMLLMDFAPGTIPSSSFPRDLTAFGTESTIFTAEIAWPPEETFGRELYISDGTSAGSRLVADLTPGESSSFSVDLQINVGARAFFTFDELATGTELWTTDGTASGTSMVRDLSPGTDSTSFAEMVAFDGHLFFTVFGPTGLDLWRTDGTDSNTISFGNHEDTEQLTVVGDWLYLASGTFGAEVFRTDGTPFVFEALAPANPTLDESAPTDLTAIGSRLFLTVYTPSFGRELWVSDSSGTTYDLVKDITPGPAWTSMSPMVDVGGRAVFTVGVDAPALWVSDGTDAGTVMVHEIDSTPGNTIPTLLGGETRAYLVAENAAGDQQLWVSDGTAAGTLPLAGLPTTYEPRWPIVVGDTLFFSVDDGVTGRELWISDDGQTARLFEDLLPMGDGDPQSFVHVGDRLYFSAHSGGGRELHALDLCAGVCCDDVLPIAGCCIADTDCTCGPEVCDLTTNLCAPPDATETACDGLDNDCDPATPDDDGTCSGSDMSMTGDMVMDMTTADADMMDMVSTDATAAADTAMSNADATPSDTVADTTVSADGTSSGLDMADGDPMGDGGCCTTLQAAPRAPRPVLPLLLLIGIATLARRTRRGR